MFDEALDVNPEVVQPEAQTEPMEETEENLETDAGQPEQEEQPAKAAQTPEENAEFADARRKQELVRTRARLADERERRERLEQKARQAEEALRMYFDGGDISSLSDNAKAQATGRTPQEVAREREQRERIAAELLERDRQLESLRMREVERQMSDDLSAIRRLDPNVKTLDELGEPYFKLIAAGVDAVTAYNAVIAGKPKPRQPDGGGKEHLIPSGGAAPKADAAEIPPGELEFYRDAFPKDTAAQLKARYNRILKRQKGE